MMQLKFSFATKEKGIFHFRIFPNFFLKQNNMRKVLSETAKKWITQKYGILKLKEKHFSFWGKSHEINFTFIIYAMQCAMSVV